MKPARPGFVPPPVFIQRDAQVGEQLCVIRLQDQRRFHKRQPLRRGHEAFRAWEMITIQKRRPRALLRADAVRREVKVRGQILRIAQRLQRAPARSIMQEFLRGEG